MRDFVRKYWFAIGIGFVYLYSFPYFAAIHHANELPRVYLTKAIVDEGTVRIDSGVKRWGRTADVSPARGHCYSNKAPGASFLAVPGYLALKGVNLGGEPSLAAMTWTFRLVAGVIPMLLFLVLLWRFLARFAPDPNVRRLVVLTYALGTMAMPYAIMFHGHQLGAICIATAFIVAVWVIEDGLDERWMLAAGAAAGAALFVDYQAVFAGVPVAVYIIYKLLAKHPRREISPARDDRFFPWMLAELRRMRVIPWMLALLRRVRPLRYAVVGAIPPVVALLVYHWRAFGHPFKTGYDFSKTFAHHHQKGFLGMDKLRWEAFTGSTVAPDNGLLFFCPMLLLAFAGWYLLAKKKDWWTYGLTTSIVAIYILFISSLNFWRGGWQLGPRYITAMLPFAMIPVAVAVSAADRRWWLRGGAVGLMLVGIVVYSLSCAEYPHFPERFKNPLYEVTFRLIGDGYAPYNLGYIFGLRGFASLVPLLLVLAALVGCTVVPRRSYWQSGVLGAAIAAAVIASYSTAGRTKDRRGADRAYQHWIAGVMPNGPGHPPARVDRRCR